MNNVDLYKIRKLPVEFSIYFAEEIGDVVHQDKELHCKHHTHPETLSEMGFICD